MKYLRPETRLKLIAQIKLDGKVKPTRRVWIPKPGRTEKRPLGIPTIRDRAIQAVAKLALEPEWEARFEAHSYGFRPGRSAQDAIEAIYLDIKQKPKWVLDADIEKCFDNINHDQLLSKLNTYPTMRRQIKAWLKAGVMDGNNLFPTKEGTPQGGTISPLLANIALHGMEEFLTKEFPETRKVNKSRKGSIRDPRITIEPPKVIRYADDLVVIVSDKEKLLQCKEALEKWLAEIGLRLKAEKTKIVHTLKQTEHKPGFNFLGFNVRQYPVSKYTRKQGYSCVIKPSLEGIKAYLEHIGSIIQNYKRSPKSELIKRLNPIIRGWSKYYSKVCSKVSFTNVDQMMFLKLWGWSVSRHTSRNKAIVYGEWKHIKGRRSFADNLGNVLMKHSDTPITRHIIVKDKRSPYDGDWTYWSQRLQKYSLKTTRESYLLKRQKGKCSLCGLTFTPMDKTEVHHIDKIRKNNSRENWILLHQHCHDRIHRKSVYEKDHITEEPDEGKLSCPVLKER